MRTASCISSVRFHHEPGTAVKTTSRNEFEPRSMTAVRRPSAPALEVIRGLRAVGGLADGLLALFDELDAVPVRVTDEAQPRAALAHGIGRLLRLDAHAGETLERAVHVLDGDRDVVVARAELVALDAVVVGQLEARAVAGQAHEDVDRLVADREAADLLEAEFLVELDGSVDVADAITRMDELHRPERTS